METTAYKLRNIFSNLIDTQKERAAIDLLFALSKMFIKIKYLSTHSLIKIPKK